MGTGKPISPKTAAVGELIAYYGNISDFGTRARLNRGY